MDYPMPRADWIPDVDFHYTEVPSPRNPLGVKGAGEAGTVGARRRSHRHAGDAAQDLAGPESVIRPLGGRSNPGPNKKGGFLAGNRPYLIST